MCSFLNLVKNIKVKRNNWKIVVKILLLAEVTNCFQFDFKERSHRNSRSAHLLYN